MRYTLIIMSHWPALADTREPGPSRSEPNIFGRYWRLTDACTDFDEKSISLAVNGSRAPAFCGRATTVPPVLYIPREGLSIACRSVVCRFPRFAGQDLPQPRHYSHHGQMRGLLGRRDCPRIWACPWAVRPVNHMGQTFSAQKGC